MKDKYIVSALLLVVVFVVGYLFVGKDTKTDEVSLLQNKQSSAQLVVKNSKSNLGEIDIMGGKVETTFSFSNEGTEPVLIFSGETSCMCTEAVIKTSDNKLSSVIKMPGHGRTPMLNKVLKSGETAELIVTYDPLAHGPNATGPVMRSIILKTNSIKTPEVTFSFQGNVIKN